jgi:hypothetical protein
MTSKNQPQKGGNIALKPKKKKKNHMLISVWETTIENKTIQKSKCR